jgi:hypothetical protein
VERAERATADSGEQFLRNRKHLEHELNLKSESELTAVARVAGSIHLATQSWGLRPRLYAFVRSADYPTTKA